MCSSPKCSGPAKSRLAPKASPMNADALRRYAQCANDAYERRQQRKLDRLQQTLNLL